LDSEIEHAKKIILEVSLFNKIGFRRGNIEK